MPSRPNQHIDNPASLRHFLRDKLYFFVLLAVALALLLLFLTALRARPETIIVATVLFSAFALIVLTIEYLRRRSFYRQLLQNIASLDRAYLVLETLSRPNFYDGAILYDALYAINKSMAEVVQNYDLEAREFRDYIEMWIHEVKTPLATLSLMSKDRKISAQINRLDSYVEQVLYFARAENAEHDYLIKPVSLAKIVSAVATKNQDLLLASGITLVVQNLDREVFTDAKWLEFILNQIILNSIKYQGKTITISATAIADKTILKVADDGIGISAKDLPRVFEKSFTGENGHQTIATRAASVASHQTSAVHSHQTAIDHQKSTGMGLYIAKTLCDKLGHQISASSPDRRGAIIEITFPKHDYYTVLRPENQTQRSENHTPSPTKHDLEAENHTPNPAKHNISKK